MIDICSKSVPLLFGTIYFCLYERCDVMLQFFANSWYFFYVCKPTQHQRKWFARSLTEQLGYTASA